MHIDASRIEGRDHEIYGLTGGLDQKTTKIGVRPGTLQDCINYEVTSVSGYTRSQGLLFFDGTYDAAVENMWYIGENDADSVFVGSGFTVGGVVTWGSGSTGRAAYWENNLAANYKVLGIVEVSGTAPALNDIFTDATTGTTFQTTVIAPTKLFSAVQPDTSAPIADTITSYLDFINNSVNTQITGQTSSSWSGFHGYMPGTGPATGGFQYNTDAYCVRDYPGASFNNGDTEISLGEVLTIGGFVGKAARIELTSGTWENGDAAGVIYFEPHDGGSNSYATFTANVVPTAQIDGGVSGMAFVGDAVDNKNAGFMWRATTGGWVFVDMGYTARYRGGEIAPRAEIAPLFVPDMTSSLTSTGPIGPESVSEIGDASFAAWTNADVTTLATDDGTDATATATTNQETKVLRAFPWATTNNFSPGSLVTGVEVTIDVHADTADCELTELRLVNTAPDAEWYLSDNLAPVGDALPTTDTPTVYGGQFDLWGTPSISVDDLINGYIGVHIQAKGGSAGGVISLDYVAADVHMSLNTQNVFLWDGASDVATGEITAMQVVSGDFTTNDAAGNYTMYNVTNPEQVVSGVEIRSEAAGAGDLFGVVSGTLERNLLPSALDMEDNSSRYVSIRANFYEDDDREAVYVCTGAGPAFSFDANSSRFSFLRTPLLPEHDTPRHVGFHANHLMLGYRSGSVIVSAVGSPNTFGSTDGGTRWTFGDKLTGIQRIDGTVTALLCESSIHGFSGTDADTFSTQVANPEEGAIEYTKAYVLGPVFADFKGISNDLSRLSTGLIDDWIKERTQFRPSIETTDKRPRIGVHVRNKGQYRLYFNDGYILTSTFTTRDELPQFTIQHYDPDNLSATYVPTFVHSHTLPSGRERVIMGTDDGAVWVVDGANGIQTSAGLQQVPCWFITNPINAGLPQGHHKQYAVTLHGMFYGAQTVEAAYGTDYLTVDAATQQTITLGRYTNPPQELSTHAFDDLHPQVLTDGFSVKVQTYMDGSRPHTFGAFIHRRSRKGRSRSRTQLSR
jgi:hypothetical protein